MKVGEESESHYRSCSLVKSGGVFGLHKPVLIGGLKMENVLEYDTPVSRGLFHSNAQHETPKKLTQSKKLTGKIEVESHAAVSDIND